MGGGSSSRAKADKPRPRDGDPVSYDTDKQPSELPVLKVFLAGTYAAGKTAVFHHLSHLMLAQTPSYPAECLFWKNQIAAVMLRWALLVLEEFEPSQLGAEYTAHCTSLSRWWQSWKRRKHRTRDCRSRDTTALEDLWQGLTCLFPAAVAVWELQDSAKVFEENVASQLGDELNRATWVHFLKHRLRIIDKDYAPTNKDMVLIVELLPSPRSASQRQRMLPLGGGRIAYNVKLVDSGGKRYERGHWKTSGKDADLIIFVAALDDLDKTLAEDPLKNRMQESIMLFRLVVGKFFSNRNVLLLLTKLDKFKETQQRLALEKGSLKRCFASYKPGSPSLGEEKILLRELHFITGQYRLQVNRILAKGSDFSNFVSDNSAAVADPEATNMSSPGLSNMSDNRTREDDDDEEEEGGDRKVTVCDSSALVSTPGKHWDSGSHFGDTNRLWTRAVCALDPISMSTALQVVRDILLQKSARRMSKRSQILAQAALDASPAADAAGAAASAPDLKRPGSDWSMRAQAEESVMANSSLPQDLPPHTEGDSGRDSGSGSGSDRSMDRTAETGEASERPEASSSDSLAQAKEGEARKAQQALSTC